MKLIFHPLFLKHELAGHPEKPERLSLLKLDNYVAAENGEKYLSLAHEAAYIKKIKGMSLAIAADATTPRSEPGKAEHLDSDTYVSRDTYEAACYAAGAAVQAAGTGGFALTRPPGHHAPYGGFCIFNNMAIAVKTAGKRTFIIDWDAHHGNGTEALLKNDKNVMCFSTHQAPLYPWTGLRSRGNAINIPLKAGAGDEDYLRIVEKKLRPALEAFQPELVGVSAGFDSYYKDAGMLTNLRLTQKSYEAVCKAIARYKVFFLLEGGYNPESVKDGVETVVRQFT
ncbi:MAG: histone deacetylase [Elusimicrobia bacterium]|nr:histone deacetylase [Elusimicrobiota bacterium]